MTKMPLYGGDWYGKSTGKGQVAEMRERKEGDTWAWVNWSFLVVTLMKVYR